MDLQESGIKVKALEGKPDIADRIHEVFLAYNRLTSRIPVSEVVVYCAALGIRDVEWMLDMVQAVDSYVLNRGKRKEQEETTQSENKAQPKPVTTRAGTVRDPYAK